jgi:DNA-binding transcriptional ArsR family regulator
MAGVKERIMLSLLWGEKDFTTLKDELKVSSPTLSTHLKDLLEKEYLEFRVEGRRKLYRLKEKAFQSPFLFSHFRGLKAASDVIRGRMDALTGLRQVAEDDVALKAFTSTILRFYQPLDGSKDGYRELISVLEEDISGVERLIGVKDLDEVREVLNSRIRFLDSLYSSLGPPLSVLWMRYRTRIEE